MIILDPSDPPFGSCAGCGAQVDITHIADAGACPECGAALDEDGTVEPLSEPERLLWAGQCPHCTEPATFSWSEDATWRRHESGDARLDELIEGHVVCNHCGFEFEGLGDRQATVTDHRRVAVVHKLGKSRLRRAAGRRLPGSDS